MNRLTRTAAAFDYCRDFCGDCKHPTEIHEKCRCYSQAKPITNGDRIRAMSDEELARWAWAIQTGIICADLYTTEDWLEWLMQGVKEANDG